MHTPFHAHTYTHTHVHAHTHTHTHARTHTRLTASLQDILSKQVLGYQTILDSFAATRDVVDLWQCNA